MISISLPSIYPEALERALTNLARCTAGPYQVIVVSPFKPPNIVSLLGQLEWVREIEPKGCNFGHASALALARGLAILAFSDDHILEPGWDDYVKRDFSGRQSSPYLLGLRQTHSNHVGTCFGLYYPYFPVISVANAHSGFWYNRVYKQDFGDIDLALRVWFAGGYCEWSSEGLITPLLDDARKAGRETSQADTDYFLDRWSDSYGEGWDTSHLRGYNININLDQPIPASMQVLGRTIVPKDDQ